MAAVANCILALLNHPEVLKKAYEEIDRAIKPGYLPDFDDQKSLPYISAIVKESSRWRDIAPLCESMSIRYVVGWLHRLLIIWDSVAPYDPCWGWISRIQDP